MPTQEDMIRKLYSFQQESNTLFPDAIKLWNKLPDYLIDITNQRGFIN